MKTNRLPALQKTKRLPVSLALALAMALALSVSILAGCGGGGGGGGRGGEPTLSGTYSLVSLAIEGATYDLDQMTALGLDAASNKIDFKEDGTYTATLFEDSDSGTYKLSGPTLTMVDSGGVEMIGAIEGDRITISEDDNVMVLEKQ